ncbi:MULTISPECIES: retention module-containing protein [unclassified Thioalkalivibrio]|uniref:retention module-containing protein n=1 Tax=unclassified Thioalkalivibrio TaxID=2621013 RepID=UPI00037AD1F5|nr:MULTISPECIES: retention module-containing protein [unclassified Thioalkalivibrio]
MSEVVVATVESVVGTVIARDEDGNTRVLQPGDEIFYGEEVIAEDGAFIEMAFEDGSTMSLAGNESATITDDLAESAEPAPEDAEIADATVEEIIEALERGEDITDMIEAPAAGAAGGAAGEGGGFVRIARGFEEVAPVNYAYDANVLRGPGESVGDDGATLGDDEDPSEDGPSPFLTVQVSPFGDVVGRASVREEGTHWAPEDERGLQNFEGVSTMQVEVPGGHESLIGTEVFSLASSLDLDGIDPATAGPVSYSLIGGDTDLLAIGEDEQGDPVIVLTEAGAVAVQNGQVSGNELQVFVQGTVEVDGFGELVATDEADISVEVPEPELQISVTPRHGETDSEVEGNPVQGPQAFSVGTFDTPAESDGGQIAGGFVLFELAIEDLNFDGIDPAAVSVSDIVYEIVEATESPEGEAYMEVDGDTVVLTEAGAQALLAGEVDGNELSVTVRGNIEITGDVNSFTVESDSFSTTIAQEDLPLEPGDIDVSLSLTEGFSELDELLEADSETGVSVKTDADGLNLTSMGKVTVEGEEYTVWRLRNGTESDEVASLSAVGTDYEAYYELPAGTDTYVLSPESDGAATHIMTVGDWTNTKAAGDQDFASTLKVSQEGDSRYAEISGSTTNVPTGNEVTLLITDESGKQVEIVPPAQVDNDGNYSAGPVDISELSEGTLTVTATVDDQLGEEVSATGTAEWHLVDEVVAIDGPSIVVTAGDDVLEGNASEGDVVATSAAEDPLGEGLTYAFTGDSNAAGYYAIDDETGEVTLTEAGADHVNGGGELPDVDVTVTDDAGRTANDDAELTVIPEPSIDGLVGDGGDGFVYETFLENGTGVVGDDAPEDAGTKASGQFTITAASGVETLAIAGEAWGINDLNGASASEPLTVETNKGVLSITDFEDNGNGTYTVDYTYELTAPADHPDEGRDELEKEAINVVVTDNTNRTAENSIDITIVDDIPVAEDPFNGVLGTESGTTLMADSGLRIGADRDGAEVTSIEVSTNDEGFITVKGVGTEDEVLLTSDGDALKWQQDEDSSGRWVAVTESEEEEVFSIFLDVDTGEYTVNLYQDLDSVAQVTASSGDLSTDGGKGPQVSVYDGENEDDSDLVITFSSDDDEVNWSGGGIGVGNQYLESGQSVTADFNQLVSQFVITDFDTNAQNQELSWVAYRDGEEVGDGSRSDFDSPYVIEPGESFDKVVLSNTGQPVSGRRGIRIDEFDVSYGSEQLDYSLPVSFDVKDGDGDKLEDKGEFDLTFSPNNVFEGSEANDVIVGTNDDDVLFGGEGDDILIGGAGDDLLTGGAGDDVFLWNSGDEGSTDEPANDVVTDFGNGDNVLDVSDLLDGASESDVADFIIAEEDGDDTVLYINSEGNLGGDADNADQTIRLEGKSFSDLGGSDSEAVINQLLTNGQLKIDQ